MRILVTGGAGFIGSALIRHLVGNTEHSVVNVDKLTYASNLDALEEVAYSGRYAFQKADICDFPAIERVFDEYRPDSVMHLAAESHVDRSIDGPAVFMQTNIVGTYTLLEVARHYWSKLEPGRRGNFRFHHVSTDEVYGDLGNSDARFTEDSPYAPSSPYSASKASSDHLVRAWSRTYGFPVLLSNCSNNYGPYQFPEKLIPHVIINALEGKPLPVYGKGDQIRDWLYVDDHARALESIVVKGKTGETYNIGGRNEIRNIDVVSRTCEILDELLPDKIPQAETSFKGLITHVSDRPGHDHRYAIDAGKIMRTLQWSPRENFETGLRKTVNWYLDNEHWWRKVLDGQYKLERIGESK